MVMDTALEIGQTRLTPRWREDLRRGDDDVFHDADPVSDWSALTWKDLGRPYRVERWSGARRAWESEHGQEMPPLESWRMFNRGFQAMFDADPLVARSEAVGELGRRLGKLRLRSALDSLHEVVNTTVWNRIQRLEDAVWDPRGKRALFEGLDVRQPSILFLGAADGYEAMQLLAMYGGGHAVLVDYDDYCRTDRFGAFPESYPFLGTDGNGREKVWRRGDMSIDFEVADIRELPYGREFDLVVSVGLLEHFPDEYKPMALEWHRRFVKPGGHVLMTTPRVQVRSKVFYMLFADVMNFAYRELMDVRQMGLYAYENGFEILRHGVIKAHNGLVARAR